MVFHWNWFPHPNLLAQELSVLLNFFGCRSVPQKSFITSCHTQEVTISVGHVEAASPRTEGKNQVLDSPVALPGGDMLISGDFSGNHGPIPLLCRQQLPLCYPDKAQRSSWQFLVGVEKVTTGPECLLSRDGTCFCTEPLLPGCSGWPQIPTSSLPQCLFF